MNFSPKKPFFSHMYSMARNSRLPFSPKSHNNTTIFEKFPVDLWGSYQKARQDNFKYLSPWLMISSNPPGHTSLEVRAMHYTL